MLRCKVFGHKFGPSVPVYTNFGIYRAKICSRCDRREPVSSEDTNLKARSDQHVNAVMNGEWARFGLKPVSLTS